MAQMTLEQILQKIKDPTALIDPREVDQILFEVSGWIGHFEEELSEIDQRVAVEYDKLAEIHGSDAAGKRKLTLTEVYKEQKKTERLIRQLKAFKQNLRRRYDILANHFN